MSIYLGENLISGVATPIDGSIAIGQIISSIIPLTDAGLHLLDGSVIQGGGVYDDFVQYIANLVNLYPQCFTDEATWQSIVSSKGVCGKFVYDSANNTVRLPKITGFIEGTVDSSALGNLVNAGLPNINGEIYAGHGNDGSSSGGLGIFRDGSGCFYEQNTKQYCPQASTTGWAGSASNLAYSNMKLNASLSNSIYGNSSTVQPQSIKVFYYIVIATNTKTDIEVDIDEVITDLNTINSNAVHKTGDENIAGIKTFTNGVVGFYRLNSTNQHIEFIYNGQDPNQGSYPGAYIPIETLGTGWKRIYTEQNFQVVSTLPASPDSNVFYFIPE